MKNPAASNSFKEACYRSYRAEHGSEQVGDVNNPFLKQLVAAHMPTDRSACVLDIGCGAGVFLNILAQAGYQNLDGVDCSPSQIANRVSPAVRLGDGAATLAEAAPDSLDVVITFDVIEHLDRDELLDWSLNVHRVLRDNGRWLVHVPNAAGIFGSRIRYSDLTHELAFTLDSLRQLARMVGFRHVSVVEDRPPVHGALSLLRRIVWQVGRLPFALLWAADTGNWRNCILSQNMTAVFYR